MSESGGLRAGPALLHEEVRSSRSTHQSSFLGGIGLPARREEGQTLLEYALIVGFVALAAVAVLTVLGPAIGEGFQAVTAIL